MKQNIKERVMQMVEDAISYDVILKLQDEVGIVSGDTDIFLELAFDDVQEKMADVVINMIRYQCQTNNLTDSAEWCSKHQDIFQD